ncbi:MAG: putative lipid II flippase FtsW [Gracilibacteraceae bacterium]|nr:putative lipid II flippase FtsW [Gracilibacteraceae bacterium]
MPDPVIIIMTLMIFAIGVTMIMTSSSAFALNATGNPYYFAIRQIMLAGFGAALVVVILFVPYELLRFLALPVMLLVFVFFALLRTGFAVTINNATRWIEIAGIQFQPSETAKVALVLFFAWWLARAQARSIVQAVVPLLAMGVTVFFTLRGPDLGTALIIAGGCYCLLLQTKIPVRWFVLAAPVVAAAVFWKIYNTPYQMDRILGWQYPWEYSSGIGLQYVQSQLAFARGGLFGVGVGASEQKYRLPESYTDSIFAIVGEELGFILTLMLVVFYVILIFRCFEVASKCRDDFGRYLAFGLTVMLALQTCVNMATASGLMPITGVTLPLVSYGGTSVIVTIISIGLILDVSRE